VKVANARVSGLIHKKTKMHKNMLSNKTVRLDPDLDDRIDFRDIDIRNYPRQPVQQQYS
jgi:hypothetical protein